MPIRLSTAKNPSRAIVAVNHGNRGPEVVRISHRFISAQYGRRDVGEQRQTCGHGRFGFAGGVQQNVVGPAVQGQRRPDLRIDLSEQIQHQCHQRQRQRRIGARINRAQRRHVKATRGDVVPANRGGLPYAQPMGGSRVQRVNRDGLAAQILDVFAPCPSLENPRRRDDPTDLDSGWLGLDRLHSNLIAGSPGCAESRLLGTAFLTSLLKSKRGCRIALGPMFAWNGRGISVAQRCIVGRHDFHTGLIEAVLNVLVQFGIGDRHARSFRRIGVDL